MSTLEIITTTIDKKQQSIDNIFNIIYFIVPDINYADLTLLMDQSHELWCNIKGNVNDRIYLKDYLHDEMGYQYFGKIYHIVFSDSNQFKKIFPDLTLFKNEKDKDDNTKKLFNILAAETRKPKEKYSHQLVLSDNTDEYILSQGRIERKTGLSEENSLYKSSASIKLTKKEKFYAEYNMYNSYKAFASLYTYYYVINENRNKSTFYERIKYDPKEQGFSSEANILFVLETEIFKITACLVLNREISEQIHNPKLEEIQKMFKRFIETRPLFEKLNYRYLGAQKEADFIYKQFQVGDMIADYDSKRELLRNYCETINSIVANKTSNTLQVISTLFTFFSGFYVLSYLFTDIFFDEKTGKIIGIFISVFLAAIIPLRTLFKNLVNKFIKK